MNVRKNIGLVIASVAGIILLIVGLVFLVKLTRENLAVQKDLKSNTASLQKLLDRSPYPSHENVKTVDGNLQLLRENFDRLQVRLREGQAEPQEIDPAEFPLVLERTIRRLQADGEAASLSLPEGFAFGFKRYSTEGQVPDPDHVPRLTLQLKNIEELCLILLDCGISAIEDVERDTFDEKKKTTKQQDQPRRGRRQVYNAYQGGQAAEEEQEDRGEPGLYIPERYGLTVVARERAIWSILNKLAASKLFAVVTSVSTENVGIEESSRASSARQAASQQGMQSYSVGMQQGQSKGAYAGNQQAKGKPEEEEVSLTDGVPGDVRASIELDVYRFVSNDQGEGKQ